MLLNPRQERIFKLITLLQSGKPISSAKIVNELDCSPPTLTRALNQIRSTYQAEIKYSKAGQTYQLVEPGTLDAEALRKIAFALGLNKDTHSQDEYSTTNPEAKVAVSLSVHQSTLTKLDQMVNKLDTNRSNFVENLLLEHFKHNS